MTTPSGLSPIRQILRVVLRVIRVVLYIILGFILLMLAVALVLDVIDLFSNGDFDGSRTLWVITQVFALLQAFLEVVFAYGQAVMGG